MPKHVFRDTLAQAFDCAVDASTADLLAYRYDPEHKGRAIYFLDFFSSMSRLLDAPYHPPQAPLALAQIGLEIIPGRTLERPAGAAAAAAPGTPSGGGSSSSSSKALSPLQLAMAGSPLAGMAGGGGQGQGLGLPAPDPLSAHWREKDSSPRRGGVGSGSGSGSGGSSSRGSAREAATGASPLSSFPKVVTHSSDSGAPYSSSSSSNRNSSSSSSAHGSSEDSDATEALLGRLRSALAQKWSGVAHGCASSLEAATSPLVQAGRSGVSADLGSPLRLNLGGASGGGRRDSSSSASAAAVSPLDKTLRLGAAARAAGGGAQARARAGEALRPVWAAQ